MTHSFNQEKKCVALLQWFVMGTAYMYCLQWVLSVARFTCTGSLMELSWRLEGLTPCCMVKHHVISHLQYRNEPEIYVTPMHLLLQFDHTYITFP